EPDGAVRAGHDLVGDGLGLLGDLVEAPADEALRRGDGPVRVERRLAPGEVPDEPLAGGRVRDDGRGGAAALGVGGHRGLAALERGDHRVGRPEINAYCPGHGSQILPTRDVLGSEIPRVYRGCLPRTG